MLPLTHRHRSLPVRSCVSLALAGLFAAAVAFAQAPEGPIVKAGVTRKIAAHTWVIPDGGVMLVPNVGIIVGDRATLIIDPGMGRRNGETVAREVAAISRHTELYVASTHYHPEHTTGYLAFPTAKYVNPKVQDEEFTKSGAGTMASFSSRSPIMADLLKDATQRRADISYDRQHTLDLGGVRVRMQVVGPTHTIGDTAFLVEEDGVLFAGDVAMNRSFVAANAASSLKAWLAALDLFDTWRPRIVVPSHGDVGDDSVIAANRAWMQVIQSRARQLKQQGVAVDDAAKTVLADLGATHPDWPRADGIAALTRSAYAEAP